MTAIEVTNPTRPGEDERGPHTKMLRKALGTTVSANAIPSEAVIDAVIAFANGDTTPDLVGYMTGVVLPEGGTLYYDVIRDVGAGNFDSPIWVDESWNPSVSPNWVDESPDVQVQIAHKRIEKERRRAVDVLARAAEGSEQLCKTLLKMRGQEMARSVLMRPYLTFNEQGSSASRTWIIEGPSHANGWILFAGIEINASAKDGKTDIGRCHWDKCGRFFRIEPKGRGKPARSYCPGTGHRDRARPSSTDRVRAWRIEDKKLKEKMLGRWAPKRRRVR